MIIPVKDILKKKDYYEGKDIAIISLIVLLHNNLITVKQLTTHASRYNTDMLTRRIKTYHSPIDDKWYRDESFHNILSEIALSKCKDFNIDVDTFLKYLNRTFSKNKSYCINILYYNYIVPLLSNIEYNEAVLNSFEFKVYINLNFDFDNASGSYCCVDCDGDYESYYTDAKKYYIKDITNKYRRNIIAELLEMKPHNKNKTGKLENEYSSLI